ncbi:MAG: nucleoside 2-deoxyribosyltransferase, partial [bacterium]
IYFAGAIRAGRDNQEIYQQIIERLKEYGEVLTEHIGKKELTTDGENLPEEKIFKRDMDYIQTADVLLAEISTPSLGVGYEIARAEQLGKKVFCLYQKFDDKHKISAMIKGNKNLLVKEYGDLPEARQFIDEFFSLHHCEAILRLLAQNDKRLDNSF